MHEFPGADVIAEIILETMVANILTTATILSLSLIFCGNTNAQSHHKKEKHKMDTVKKYNYLPDDFNVAFYRNHPLLLKRPLRVDSTKSSFKQRFPSNQSKLKEINFLMEMNRKLDSAWRKFDQRYRARNKF